MIAIRVYWNPAEAALEKSLLDNYEVQSEIAAVTVSHFLGWIAITFALLLLVLFGRNWRSPASMQNLSDQVR